MRSSANAASSRLLVRLSWHSCPCNLELLLWRARNGTQGRYNGVPVSAIAIGMGGPNMDFFVREARECLDGEMVIVRQVSPIDQFDRDLD